MSLKAPVAPPVPYLAWQGWYFGGNIGGALLNATASHTFDSEDGSHVACIGGSEGYRWALGSCSTNATGVVGGVQAGYDWQQRSFVYGVAADWTWTNLSHTLFSGASSIPFFKAKVDWLASFRTRMGLAVEDTLVYITGGLALGDLKSSIGQILDCPTYCYATPLSKVKAGWVAGFGVEHKFTQNLSFFSEFLYYGFGRASAAGSTPDGTYSYTTEFTHQIFVSRAGVNWRF
jgi:outer membrane immunogenic protein